MDNFESSYNPALSKLTFTRLYETQRSSTRLRDSTRLYKTLRASTGLTPTGVKILQADFDSVPLRD